MIIKLQEKKVQLTIQISEAYNKLKEQSRLMPLYKTDADHLSKSEEKIARSFFRIDCRNMIHKKGT